MNALLPSEAAKVVVGVCGEQGSGKTVFLTCIFQSIWNVVPDDLVIRFDRREVGNASYFQSIEDALLREGPTPGTTDRSLFPVRLFVEPYPPPPGIPSPVLSVDLLDFAGRHFRSMADLKNLLDSGEGDADELRALREVNGTLERADAFVILINSTEIDPLEEKPKRHPFSPSVNYMLAHCRVEHKPVALLFTQIDQTPRLTEELFQTLPRVQEFERKFTSDRDEAAAGKRPFGIVRRISCYETVPGDLAPRRQSDDGNIWLPDPAQVVLELLRAAMPRINARLAEAAAAEKKRLEEEEARKRDAERAAARLRKQLLVAGLAAVVLVAILLALLGWAWHRRVESQKVQRLQGAAADLQAGRLVPVPQALQAGLGAILDEHRAAPADSSPAMRDAIEGFAAGTLEAGQRLVREPTLDAPYRDGIAIVADLNQRLGAATAPSPLQEILPRLAARRELLVDWLGTERPERSERTRFLDQSAQRFQEAGDAAFATLLSTTSTMEKLSEVAGWGNLIDADADVASRVATLQGLLASALAEGDPERSRLARKAVAEQLATTLLKQQENGLVRDKVLATLVPDLARLGDGEVRFEVLARYLLECADAEACANRETTLRTASEEAATATAGWSSAVDNLLRSLLLDQSVEGRREVWQALAQSLARAYIFNPRSDAWPSEVVPLHSRIAGLASSEDDWTLALIERVAQHPIYDDELHYLGDRLTATEIRRRVVPVYSSILTALEERQQWLPTNGLTAVGQQLSSVLADRTAGAGPLSEIGQEIDQALLLTQSVNDQTSRNAFGRTDEAAERLERLLRAARRGHCAALASHEAPSECADAA